jgi:hypothetical protein
VDFEVIERATVPKRAISRASKWKKVIEAAVANEGKFVLVKKITERTERSVMAALTGFGKRHPDLLQGKRLRTMTHTEGGVLVWATSEEAPKETAAA